MNDITGTPEGEIDFAVIADLFLSYGSLSSPAFFDGRMTASLALGQSTENEAEATDDWLREICSVLGVESPRDREDAALILGWRSQAKARLSEEEMEFEPLLPDELFSVTERVESLKSWALGFCEVVDDQGRGENWSAALNEAVDALQEISQLDIDEGLEDNSETEADLLALIEHARITALTVYLESHPGKPHVLDDQPQDNGEEPPSQLH